MNQTGAAQYVLARRERLERAAGRLPRRVAYPLILLFSLLMWIPIGILAFRVLAWAFA